MTRDSYIVAKALAYAVAAIDMLPPERQAGDARDDMTRALDRMDLTDAERFRVVEDARRLVGDQCAT